MHVWANDQGIRTLYVGNNKVISQTAYLVVMVWLYAEICNWLPGILNIQLRLMDECLDLRVRLFNTTGWITTKLRWFTLKLLHFICQQLLKILEKSIYSVNVPTAIRMVVLSLPNWVFFNLILIIVQRDAIQSSLFIILQVHSTCFGCQLHPSSGVHKTVTTA